ncbi:hypothetical protein RN001_009354 [Aquatica leii]|uniref:Serine hydroxymethyltransferase-like domain-containing protein n=1 Tax=Aquatica leii TaxID=1421715 RepID=A0AAN7P6I6_9COLE|nr:hypothetical protein RN001_009354 [Aquatica leii]
MPELMHPRPAEFPGREIDVEVCFVCKKCRVAFPGESPLLIHQRQCFSGNLESRGAFRIVQFGYECKYCVGVERFKSFQDFRRHCESDIHMKTAKVSSSLPPPSESPLSHEMEDVVNQITLLAARAAQEARPDTARVVDSNLNTFCQPPDPTKRRRASQDHFQGWGFLLCRKKKLEKFSLKNFPPDNMVRTDNEVKCVLPILNILEEDVRMNQDTNITRAEVFQDSSNEAHVSREVNKEEITEEKVNIELQGEDKAQKRAVVDYNLNPEEWGVNVQLYFGFPENLAVYTGLIGTHSCIMGLDLADGCHLTHGFATQRKKIFATAMFFESMAYKVDFITGLIDYNQLAGLVKSFRPKLIITRISCYSRV